MVKIQTPVKGYSGHGPGGVVFEDGVGDTDDEAALNYYRSAGYTVGGKKPKAAEDQVDAREVAEEVVVGTRLRDAAVDPEPVDFLPPVNAGQEDPHGAKVVSPEVHASGPAGVRPGVVFVEDVDKQQARESAYAEARLIDQMPAQEAVAVEVPDTDERGALGLSDPGSVVDGEPVTDTPDEDEADEDGDEPGESTTKRTRTRKRNN